MTHWWEENYPAAPAAYSLAMARGSLARLYGDDLELIPVAPGECEECQQASSLARLRYGRFSLCRRCALRRRAARDKAA